MLGHLERSFHKQNMKPVYNHRICQVPKQLVNELMSRTTDNEFDD